MNMNMESEGSSVATTAKTPDGVPGWLESFIVTVSQTSLGQALLKLVDRFLWVVEKSAEWSLPCQEITAEENGKSFGRMELVRPLPWILFLPGLVILRAIRGGLNVGAFVLGYPQIQPTGMVKFVQKGRRRLRALNLKAVKNIRRKTCNAKDKRLSMIEAKKALIRSIRLTLSTLSCLDSSKSSPSPPPTKIRITSTDLETATTPDEKSTTESAGSPTHIEAKRKFSQVSSDESSDESENETLQSRIERLALEESTDDPDFNPNDCSTESNTTSSENDDADGNVSLTELEDVKREAQLILEDKNEFVSKFFDAEKANASQEKSAAVESHDEENRVAATESVDGADSYYTPKRFGQDGEATFYSPISSKSASPERSISPHAADKDVQLQANSHNDFTNAEINFTSGSTHSASTEDVTNGVVSEKRSANAGKFQHKGKRTGHGNRKKK